MSVFGSTLVKFQSKSILTESETLIKGINEIHSKQYSEF